MNCNIIQDLLPLYIDEICSSETKAAVEEHLATCADCKNLYNAMIREVPTQKQPAKSIPEKSIYLRIRRQLGNMLLCAILFIALVGLSFGMINEIGDHGWQPGLFAVVFVVPCTAFILSLLSVIILKKISHRPIFPWIAAGINLAICVAGELYTLNHYSTQTEAVTLIPYCAVLGLLFTAMSYFISRLYSNFCRR